MSSASEHTSNIALLRSIFVENLDLLVVASEDNNICKYTLHAVFDNVPLHILFSHCHLPVTANRNN